MPLTINVSPEKEATYHAFAQAQGLSVEQWFLQLAEQFAAPPLEAYAPDIEPVRRKHISEVIRDNMRDVPLADLAALPSDGASQHDHYIYGVPKRKL